jgi:hypothetical protein
MLSKLYVLVMIVVIVAADVLFLRGHFWERLLVNVGIVVVSVLVYVLFLKGR